MGTIRSVQFGLFGEYNTNCWIKKMIFEKTEVSFTMENILYLY